MRPALEDALQNDRLGHMQLHDERQGALRARELGAEQLRLAERAWESIEDPVVVLHRVQLRAHELHHRRVRHESPGADRRRGRVAERRALPDVRAQQVAGRDDRHAKVSLDARRQRALARAGAPDHQHPKRRSS